MNIPFENGELQTGTNIKISENGKSFELNSKIPKFYISAKIKTTDKPRCDYILLNITDLTIYLVEFKGRNIDHALEQIQETIELFKSQNPIKQFTFHARIVAQKTNHSSNLLKNKEKIVQDWKKNYKGIFSIGTIAMTENI